MTFTQVQYSKKIGNIAIAIPMKWLFKYKCYCAVTLKKLMMPESIR